MLALILFIVFGLVFGYFATLNTSSVSVNFGTQSLHNVPLYVLVLTSLSIGIAFATIFYAVKFLGTRLMIHKKDKELASANKEIAEITKALHKSELENSRLKGKTGEEEVEDENSL